MKNSNYYQPNPHQTISGGTRRLGSIFRVILIFAGLIFSGMIASAQSNVLVNPGAEAGSYSGWNQYGNAGYNFGTPTNQAPPHSGTYCFWMYGNYGDGSSEYNGFYQFVSAFPGQVFTADGWEYQVPTDAFPAGDGNNAFIEVTFQDISGNTLARYRSVSITSNSPTGVWTDLGVTNIYDVNTYAFLGTTNQLVAPPGSVRVEWNTVFNLVNYAGGSTYWDDFELLTTAPPPPYITNVSPTVILATNTNFTFTAEAQAGQITNVQVTVVSSQGLVNPVVATNVYGTNTPALTLSGIGTATVNGSLPLTTNTTYSVSLIAFCNTGQIATANQSFDTIQPVLVWEAEDFNFTNGMFLDTTPDGGTWVYSNLVGTASIDENKIGGPGANGGGAAHFYRATDAVSIQGAFEAPREKFLVAQSLGETNVIDEEVGYNSPGDWLDYTRTFPAGKYNVYARLATVGSGTMLNFGQVTSTVSNNTSQTVTNLGTFSFTDNGWNTYAYVPLLDSFGNLVSVTMSGQPETFRSTVVGNPNINFYMLVPAVGSQRPALIQSYPTGLHPFEPTNSLSFTIGPAAGSPINSNAIHLSLNGFDMTPLLSITAGPTNTWNCSIPVASNALYVAVINVTNSTSLSSKFTINFDTFSQNNFMWEAEDWDFNGGQFIDNPLPTGDDTLTGGTPQSANGTTAPNSYYGYPEGNSANAGIYGIDFTTIASNDGADLYYRPFENVGTELNFDYLRQKFLDARAATGDPNIGDFDVGWFNGGWWLNYTRTYPTGQFYVYGRLAGGAGPFSGTTLSMVTGGWGTTNQSTQLLGSFSDPNAGGWQTWHWLPLIDTNNHVAIVSLSGTNTIKLTSGNNLNANYFMLVPAASPLNLRAIMSGTYPAVSFQTQAGFNYTILYKNNLSDPAWKALTIVSGDGTVKTITDSTGGSQRFYKVMVQ
ncbi:MAG TPA: hypothetical protein VFB72_06530 [Verrucomicrobiae bacterium]|nr:hypothetical protein [Verrucomicrobiae bacterium]